MLQIAEKHGKRKTEFEAELAVVVKQSQSRREIVQSLTKIDGRLFARWRTGENITQSEIDRPSDSASTSFGLSDVINAISISISR
jgi:hypothetical protein